MLNLQTAMGLETHQHDLGEFLELSDELER